MNNLDLFNFQFENTFKLSQKSISYIESLTISKEIKIFLEIPKCASENEVGWAFAEERQVYIRPTDDVENFELRLVHELTHISINDEGYPNLACYSDDMLGKAFANLLHHFIIYNKMKGDGFSMKHDSELVMNNIEQRLMEFSDLCKQGGYDEWAYTVMIVINDLIRLTDEDQNNYILVADKHIPNYLNKAKDIIKKVIPTDSEKSLNIEWYKDCKKIIEKILKIEEFQFNY